MDTLNAVTGGAQSRLPVGQIDPVRLAIWTYTAIAVNVAGSCCIVILSDVLFLFLELHFGH